MRYIYTVFFYIALPFVFLRLLWRSRQLPSYRQRWAERLGFCPHRLDQCIWVHAVSVGEIIAAVPLIKALQARYPERPLLVTNMTPTGAARTKALLGDSVLQAYIPYDVPDAVARFLKRVNPQVGVIIETELWPNLFAACQKRHIPIAVVNARLSVQSIAGYRMIAPFMRQVLSAVHVLAAQTQADADRFKTLGMSAARITVTGNIKFDIELPVEIFSQKNALRQQLGEDRFIWIAASTHEKEEEIILAAHRLISQKFPKSLLVLVPRHPDRFEKVFALIEQQGFQVIRRSQGKKCEPATQIYFGDTMGEMLLLYAVSDVAFVGGSFITLGGHNMLEPAILEKPIITGPHLFNFTEISELLQEAKGAVVTQDANGLAAEVCHLFQNENYRKQMGANARDVVLANRGALAKQMRLVNTLIC